jgi:hypothetical protein
MINVMADACCWACGFDGDGTEAGVCGKCEVPRDTPQALPRRVGRVVELGGRLRTVRGVALNEADGRVEVLGKGETTTSMPVEEFDRLRSSVVPGPAVIGAAGRLWSALAACRSGKLTAKWRPELVEQAARARATATLGARRAAALDAFALGETASVDDLGLTSSELIWCSAHAVCAAGRTDELLDRLEQLPPDSYSTRAMLLLARYADLRGDPRLAARAANQLRPFAERIPDAGALLAVLDREHGPAALDVLTRYADHVADDFGAEANNVRAWAACIAGLGQPPESLGTTESPTVRALGAYEAGRAGTVLDSRVGELAPISLALVDELIDGSAITSAAASDPAWPAENAAYLHCRLDPGNASDEEVAASRFPAETARRWFRADARAALSALEGDDPRVRHYQALACWSGGARPGDPELDGLTEPARETVAQFEKLRAELSGGDGPRQLPEAVAADPSLWSLLTAEARAGRLELTPALIQRYPRCADWLDLHLVQRLLFEGLWKSAADEGQALAHRASTADVRAEAQTMMGCALAQLGRLDEAFNAAHDAASTLRATGFLVNAAILATAARGTPAAIPYLGMIALSDGEFEVRDKAILYAVLLWLEETGPDDDYTETMETLVRTELARPHHDGTRRLLLVLASIRDAVWLATAEPILVDGEEQSGQLRYYRTLARSGLPGYPETRRDVAVVLGALAKRADARPWVANELAALVDALNDEVHCPFGEAVHLVPTILTLHDAGVLDPPYRAIFAAQAAAHLAAADEGQGLSAAQETRLLFQNCAAYLAADSDVVGDVRGRVGRQLALCVRFVSACVADSCNAAFNAAAPRWSALLQQRAYAYSPALIHQQIALLNGLQVHVDRLNRYQDLLAALPREDDEAAARWRERLPTIIREWSGEIARLRSFI